MLRAKLYRWVIVSISCATMLAPSTSYGFCCNWFKKQPAPALACDPCNPCAVKQTVTYVPQTCYRTQYVTIPVTTYRPALTCSPCGGCPTTTMRPVVTNVQRPVLVPYTTYRLVYTNGVASCAQPIAAPAYAPAAYAPAATYAPAPNYAAPATYAAPALGGCGTCGTATMGYAPPMMSGGCNSCGPSAATYAPQFSTPNYSTPAYASPAGSPGYSVPGTSIPTYGQPSVPTYSQPSLSTPPAGGSTYAVPGSTTPSYNQPPSYAPPTYAPPSTPSVGPATSTPSLTPTPGPLNSTPSNTLKPIPDTNLNNGSRVSPSSSPRLIDPESRTTSIPVYRPWSSSTVAWPNHPVQEVAVRTASATQEEPAPVVAPPKPAKRLVADDDGWRASSR